MRRDEHSRRHPAAWHGGQDLDAQQHGASDDDEGASVASGSAGDEGGTDDEGSGSEGANAGSAGAEGTGDNRNGGADDVDDGNGGGDGGGAAGGGQPRLVRNYLIGETCCCRIQVTGAQVFIQRSQPWTLLGSQLHVLTINWSYHALQH